MMRTRETNPEKPHRIFFSITLAPFVIVFVNKKMSIKKRVKGPLFAVLAVAVTAIVIPIGAIVGTAYIGYRSFMVPINGLKVFKEDAEYYMKEDPNYKSLATVKLSTSRIRSLFRS